MKIEKTTQTITTLTINGQDFDVTKIEKVNLANDRGCTDQEAMEKFDEINWTRKNDAYNLFSELYLDHGIPGHVALHVVECIVPQLMTLAR